MIHIVAPEKLIKYISWALFLIFIGVNILFENNYILESTEDIAMHYIGYIALLYFGVVLGFFWTKEYNNFVSRCRRSYVNGMWQSEVIKDYIYNEEKYFRYWLIRTALYCLAVLICLIIFCGWFYIIANNAEKGSVIAGIFWSLIFCAIEIYLFSTLMRFLSKYKPNFYTKLNELFRDVKKY